MPALHSVLFPDPISITFQSFSWVLPPLVESEVLFVELQCDDPPPTLNKSKEMELKPRLISFRLFSFLWFWSKIGNFTIFLLLRKIFYEMPFYDIKTNLKTTKKWDSSKGVNPWFWWRNGDFSIFFLGKIGSENVFYHILEQKKHLSRL